MKAGHPSFEYLSVVLIWWGGMILVILGLAKVAIYAVGASKPDLFSRIPSETLRRFLNGRGNRVVFGWGGFLTAAVGALFLLAAKGLAWLIVAFRL